MKRVLTGFICFTLILSFIMSLWGCTRHKEYNDVSRYDDIFKEFGAFGEIYFLFPHSDGDDYETFTWYCNQYNVDDSKSDEMRPPLISSLDVIDFYADYHTNYLFSNTYIEILLIVEYNEKALKSEINRISNLAVTKNILFDSENYPLPAYVACANAHTYCYALIDETQKTISYVYIQLKSAEEANVVKDLLPHNYDNSSLNSFSILEY